jgi:hypothetical protein
VHALLPGTKTQTSAEGQEGAACRCMHQVTSVLWEDLELNMKYGFVGLGFIRREEFRVSSVWLLSEIFMVIRGLGWIFP